MSAIQPDRMSYAAYLEAEQRSETKHEYLRGGVYAMARGTPEHAALAMAVGAALTPGEWVLSEAGAGEVLTLASLEGVRLETDAIYRDPLAPQR